MAEANLVDHGVYLVRDLRTPGLKPEPARYIASAGTPFWQFFGTDDDARIDEVEVVAPEEHLKVQADELRNLGYEAAVDGDRIVVRLSVTEAIFLQGETIIARQRAAAKKP